MARETRNGLGCRYWLYVLTDAGHEACAHGATIAAVRHSADVLERAGVPHDHMYFWDVVEERMVD